MGGKLGDALRGTHIDEGVAAVMGAEAGHLFATHMAEPGIEALTQISPVSDYVFGSSGSNSTLSGPSLPPQMEIDINPTASIPDCLANRSACGD